ncbi:MAG: phosphoglycerate dehydrogenase [Actinobacteria bacterium]|nr:phosphoglycerate dehydrogenase [Actinomycetota bacterium]MCL5071925.1 phosphoglycerate dehydrogenase [Actinomycetota bacterium]
MSTFLITVVPYQDVIDNIEREIKAKNYKVKLDYSDARWKEADLLKKIKDIDALIADSDEVTSLVIESANQLKVISRCGMGIDNIDVDSATRNGIVVTNTPGVMAPAVADLTFALILALARKIPFADCATKSGEWPRIFGQSVAGKTLGVIGVGYIGKEVVKRAMGFGMRIMGYDLKHDENFARRYNLEYVSLDTLLMNSDFVSVNVSLNPSTKHMIGEKQFKLMKKTALFFNTSRGAVVDENALCNALTSNLISGAGIDTFESEPPVSSPLLKMKNVITTPHIGSSTYEAMRDMAYLSMSNAVDVLEGKKPQFVVNSEVLKKVNLK